MAVITDNMRILVMRTNIETLSQKDQVLEKLLALPQVKDASVDMEDIDRVLRVVGDMLEHELIDLVSAQDITCSELE